MLEVEITLEYLEAELNLYEFTVSIPMTCLV